MGIDEIKHTVTAIILNDKNQVLGVSRKDDHTDFGLIGGKVDDEDQREEFTGITYTTPLKKSLHKAIKREVKEETGLDIDTSTMIELLSMPKHMVGETYWGHTFLIRDWSGEIGSDEPHVIKWTTFEELEKGCFGPWNTITKDCLKAVGINIK